MWSNLFLQSPDLQKLMDICYENFVKIESTNDLYRELIALNNTSSDLKNIMDVYAS